MKLTIDKKKKILNFINGKDLKRSIVSIKPNKDYSGGEIQYSKKIKQHREIKTITGDEE